VFAISTSEDIKFDRRMNEVTLNFYWVYLANYLTTYWTDLRQVSALVDMIVTIINLILFW